MDPIDNQSSEGLNVGQTHGHIWEQWTKEQGETITNILSDVFKVAEEARQVDTPSRLLRNPAIESHESEQQIRDKLKQLRQQISEYDQILQSGLKRIDAALGTIDPPAPPQPPERLRFNLKTWLYKLIRK